MGRVNVLAGLLAAVVLFGAAAGSGAAPAQPSYDTLRIESDGNGFPYQVWVAWSPLVLTTPDGGAWTFFSAQVQRPEGLGSRKLWVSRFDPATGVWLPATALPGGEIQFGPSGVVDANGLAHVIYTDRTADDPAAFGTLYYIRSTPEGGWTEPVAVAPNENAGHQLSPALTIDANGALHLVWQDQRGVSAEARAASASNADVFFCDLDGNGVCAQPQTLSTRTKPDANGSRPQVVVDGDRIVVLWSVYEGTTEEALASAQRVEWSSRPLADPAAAWSEPAVLLERGDSQMGGRLLDSEADPTGGVVLVFGRRTDVNTLYLTKLAAGQTAWSEPIALASGDRGSFPTLGIGADGTAYITYNVGSGTSVQVGAIALAPGQTRAGVEMMLTQGEDGAQGRPVMDIDANGRVWVVYLHEPPGGTANEVRSLRGAVIPSEPAPEVPATPVATPESVATPTS